MPATTLVHAHPCCRRINDSGHLREGQVGEDLTQQAGRQPEIPEHLEGVAELMDRDQVEEWLQAQATRTAPDLQPGTPPPDTSLVR
jgi:hypothetical protein